MSRDKGISQRMELSAAPNSAPRSNKMLTENGTNKVEVIGDPEKNGFGRMVKTKSELECAQ